VIAPQAEVKIFVMATAEERAKRRQAELSKRGEVVSFETMLAQIQERDARDSGRKDAPLAMAPDAILLDTTTLSIDAAIAEARAVVARARI
jgi:cytidylate kinase